jgi:hypothetical protein
MLVVRGDVDVNISLGSDKSDCLSVTKASPNDPLAAAMVTSPNASEGRVTPLLLMVGVDETLVARSW